SAAAFSGSEIAPMTAAWPAARAPVFRACMVGDDDGAGASCGAASLAEAGCSAGEGWSVGVGCSPGTDCSGAGPTAVPYAEKSSRLLRSGAAVREKDFGV